MAVSFQVTMDCANPDRLATFWAEVLRYKKQEPPPGYASWQEFAQAMHMPAEDMEKFSAIVDPDGKGARLFFQQVPEGKSAKNRVHLDVNIGGGAKIPEAERIGNVNSEADRLLGLGATKVRTVAQYGEYWIIMADPEGNEFCLQ